MEEIKNTKALFIIVNAGFAEDALDIARGAGAKGATILNARGAGPHHEVFMGITVDSEKEIILSLVPEEVAEKTMSTIKEKAGIGTPIHGICFTLPIDKMVGILPAAQKPEK